MEENGKIPFLDCLFTRDNNRLLDESSYNSTSHKASAIRTFTRQALLELFATRLTACKTRLTI